jgi:hypothetical protein
MEPTGNFRILGLVYVRDVRGQAIIAKSGFLRPIMPIAGFLWAIPDIGQAGERSAIARDDRRHCDEKGPGSAAQALVELI